ncbi:MAG: conjugal transfer protein TrbL [Propionibacteriaceae bacterium]|nr:conjugal transfer protein TrbL [Propionibacteriaceae bacterium]
MGVCDVPGISYVCEKVGEGAASLVSAPFDWLASACGKAAGWVFEQVWNVFDKTTLVDVTNPQYTKVYALMFGVAVMVMLIFFCFQLITGLIRHEPGALGRAVTGLAKAVLGSFLILTLTGLLLEATDQISIGIVQATGNTMESMGGKIAVLAAGLTGIDIAAPGAGAILTIFLAGLAISSALVVWFSLLIRKALLLVALVFGPFAMAGSSWDHARGWFGKWASFVIAMILSKLVLVVTLLVGVSMAGSPLEPDLQSVGDAVTGVVVMLIATFAPYMAYKFISFMGADMYHLMSAEQEAKSALNRPVPIKPTPSNPPSTLGGGSGSSGGSTPSPSSPSPATASTTSTDVAATDGAAGAGAGSAGAGASGGAAAAAGPAAAVIIGAQVVQGAAEAGPALGGTVAGAADSAGEAAEPTPPSAPTPTPSMTVFTPTGGTPPPEPPPAPAQAA